MAVVLVVPPHAKNSFKLQPNLFMNFYTEIASRLRKNNMPFLVLADKNIGIEILDFFENSEVKTFEKYKLDSKDIFIGYECPPQFIMQLESRPFIHVMPGLAARPPFKMTYLFSLSGLYGRFSFVSRWQLNNYKKVYQEFLVKTYEKNLGKEKISDSDFTHIIAVPDFNYWPHSQTMDGLKYLDKEAFILDCLLDIQKKGENSRVLITEKYTPWEQQTPLNLDRFPKRHDISIDYIKPSPENSTVTQDWIFADNNYNQEVFTTYSNVGGLAFMIGKKLNVKSAIPNHLDYLQANPCAFISHLMGQQYLFDNIIHFIEAINKRKFNLYFETTMESRFESLLEE